MTHVATVKHSELVKYAVDYLKISKKCNPVFAEKGSARISEIPDVVGWNTECLIVECKVSIGDLRVDIKKSFRHDGKGLGDRRFYLLAAELYEQIKNRLLEFIPSGWGILVYYEQVRQPRKLGSSKFESNLVAERDYLRSRILEVQRFGR